MNLLAKRKWVQNVYVWDVKLENSFKTSEIIRLLFAKIRLFEKREGNFC